MLSFIDPALLGKIALYVGLLNVAISAVKQILDKVATGSAADTFIGKAAGILSVAVDYLTANLPH